MRRAVITVAVLVCSILAYSDSFAQSRKIPPPLLDVVTSEIKSLFARVDLLMSSAATRIAGKGLASEESRQIVRELCPEIPQATLCAVTDIQGLVTIIEPEKYSRYQGTNVIGQKYVAMTLSNAIPVLSKSFRNEEGFFGVFFAYPIVSPSGTPEGAVLVLFRPDRFIGEAVRRTPMYIPVEIAVLQEDGTVLYSATPADVGRNVFSDPDTQGYRQLISLAWRVKKEPSGTGSYIPARSRSEKPVKKLAYWETAALYGTEWRVLLLKQEEQEIVYGPKVEKKPDFPAFDRSLRAFCKNPETVREVSAGDTRAVTTLFRSFYDRNKGLYSLQFVNPSGINLFGYPRENSLTNYNFYERRDPHDEQLLAGIREKKEVVFEKTLVEGGTGRFFVCPVFKDTEYLGSIYSVIRLK
ncbi:MAG TPA: hypothetical protein VLD40_06795 [Dissulfurispiraceae bacterium]|nr:hypothetical protein [Dissulfurispiraceae bacterium]